MLLGISYNAAYAPMDCGVYNYNNMFIIFLNIFWIRLGY